MAAFILDCLVDCSADFLIVFLANGVVMLVIRILFIIFARYSEHIEESAISV